LVESEQIKTTEQKAKSVKPQIERLVTKAKKGETLSRHLLQPYLTPDAVKKMFGEIAPRFTNRPGGYTRIRHLERRFNDNASMVLLEWVEKGSSNKITVSELKEKKTSKNPKKETKSKNDLSKKETKSIKPMKNVNQKTTKGMTKNKANMGGKKG